MIKNIKRYSILCALNASFMLNAASSTTDITLPNEMLDTSASPSNIIFSEVDQKLFALYPGTLSGAKEIDLTGIKYVSAVLSKNIAASKEDLERVQNFYSKQLYAFLNLIKNKKTLNEEQNLLWQKIWDDASAQEFTNINSNLFNAIYGSFLRAAILASDHISEEALDFLRSVPGMTILFASLHDGPEISPGEKNPAWKYSLEACLSNLRDPKIRSTTVHKKIYYDSTPLSSDCHTPILEEMSHLGLAEDAMLVFMPGIGKTGITTMLKLWFNNIYPISLPLDDYCAHGLSLSSAIAAMHDYGHQVVDNRLDAILKSILSYLKTTYNNGHHVDEHIPVITQIMVKRYNAFNQMLLKYIEKKELALINEINTANLLENEEDQKQNKIRAKQKYNKGIGTLFLIFHEFYMMNKNVLLASTFEESLYRLTIDQTSPNVKEGNEDSSVPVAKKAKVIKENPILNELTTFLNPQSTMTDPEIHEIIRLKKISEMGVLNSLHFHDTPDVPKPVTIGDLEKFGHISFSDIKRNAVFTEISFRIRMGNSNIIERLSTSDFLLNTAKDTNAILALAGMKVKENEPSSVKKLLNDAKISREEALERVNIWYNTIEERAKELILSFNDDVLSTFSYKEVKEYDNFLAADEKEINERIKPLIR